MTEEKQEAQGDQLAMIGPLVMEEGSREPAGRSKEDGSGEPSHLSPIIMA
jgi:hypothetical protein